MFNIKNVSIDSCVIIVPTSNIVDKDNILKDDILVLNANTMEILDYKNFYVQDEFRGIKTSMRLVNLFGKQFLSFGLTAKMLGTDYLQGITHKNYMKAIQYVERRTGLYFHNLDNAILHDCDIKYDFYMSDREFNTLVNFYNQFPTARRYKRTRQSFKDTPQWSGIQLVTRKDASIGNPFIKFYTKADEMMQRDHSRTFAEFYNIKPDKELRRLEGTIKNASHFKNLGVTNNFKAFVGQYPQLLDNLLFKLLSKYSDNPITCNKPIERPKIALNKHIIFTYMTELMILQSHSLKTVLNLPFYDNHFPIQQQSKSRKITEIKREFVAYVSPSLKLRGYRMKETKKDAYIVPLDL